MMKHSWGFSDEAEKRYYFVATNLGSPLYQLFLPATESYNFSMVSLMSSMQYLSLAVLSARLWPYPPSQPFPTDLAELSYYNHSQTSSMIINDPVKLGKIRE